MSYLQEMFGCDTTVVAITGGGGVIAGALAEALLKAGARVSLWDIHQKDADAAQEHFDRDGRQDCEEKQANRVVAGVGKELCAGRRAD